MVWLDKLPNSCMALLFGVIGAALFMGVLFLRVKLLRIQVQSDHAKAAHDALTVVIGFVGLILAFSLAREQNNLRNLEAQIATEANNPDITARICKLNSKGRVARITGKQLLSCSWFCLYWRRSLKAHFHPEPRWRLAVRVSP